MRLWGATSSHVGNVREINQDRVYFRGAVAAVADGMGGHQGGERAAELAIGEFRIVRAQLSPEELVDVIEEANRQVHLQAVDPDLRGMGTTMVAMSLHPNGTMTVVNVGDSRAYWLRGDTLAQITEDHSFVEDLVRQGRLSPEEAAIHPQRNILTRALGIADSVEVDRFEIDPQVGDRLLLCSDGLFNEVTSAEITKILDDNDDPTDAAKALVSAALDTPCRDNVSVAVVSVVDDNHPSVVGTSADLGIDLSAPRSPSAEVTARFPIVQNGDVIQMPNTGTPDINAFSSGGGSGPADGPMPDNQDLTGQMFPADGNGGQASASQHEEYDLGHGSADYSADNDGDGQGADYAAPAAGLATTTGVIERPVVVDDNADQRSAYGAGGKSGPRRRRGIWPLVLGLLFGGLAAVGYFGAQRYNDSLHHVQVVDDELVVFQGRSGGLLWLQPTEVERSGRFVSDLTEDSQQSLAGWGNFESLKDAQLAIDILETDLEPVAEPATDGDAGEQSVEASTGAADSGGDTESEGESSESNGSSSSTSNGG